MTEKKIRLEIVEKIPKKWDTKKGGSIMPIFPRDEKGIYHMVEQETPDGNRIETFCTFETKGNWISSFLMYDEIIQELKNGGSILVDETVLKIKDL